MEIVGKLVQLLPEQTGSSARGQWKKQDFIIETEEEYPKKVCISNWNKVDIASVPVGSPVKCWINIESREFNQRWYTDVKVWRMEVLAENGGSADSPAAPPMDMPPPSLDDMPFESDDDDKNDLPF